MIEDLRYFSRKERKFIDVALRYLKEVGLDSVLDLREISDKVKARVSVEIDDGELILENMINLGLAERSQYGVILAPKGRFHIRKRTFASRYYWFKAVLSEMKFWLASTQFILGAISFWIFQYFYNLYQSLKSINVPFMDRFSSGLIGDVIVSVLEISLSIV